MNYVRLGKLVNTHGIKGEIRIVSDFKYKSRVFKPGVKLYIGLDKEEVTIKTYRHHKNFEMCVFDEYDYINDVLKFKGSYVFVDREILNLGNDEYLDEDLIGLTAIYGGSNIGSISRIVDNNGYKLFLVYDKYIPYNFEFIDNIDLEGGKIVFKNLEGLI